MSHWFLVPESGDKIQLIKSGLMEIADIFIVNKSDRPGADLLHSEIFKNAKHNDSQQIFSNCGDQGPRYQIYF